MGIGVSIFMIALGAIVKFATDFQFSEIGVGVRGIELSFDLDAIGVILMVAGGLGLLVTLVLHRRVGGDAGGARRMYY